MQKGHILRKKFKTDFASLMHRMPHTKKMKMVSYTLNTYSHKRSEVNDKWSQT